MMLTMTTTRKRIKRTRRTIRRDAKSCCSRWRRRWKKKKEQIMMNNLIILFFALLLSILSAWTTTTTTTTTKFTAVHSWTTSNNSISGRIRPLSQRGASSRRGFGGGGTIATTTALLATTTTTATTATTSAALLATTTTTAATTAASDVLVEQDGQKTKNYKKKNKKGNVVASDPSTKTTRKRRVLNIYYSNSTATTTKTTRKRKRARRKTYNHAKWNRMYKLLKAFYDEHGHSYVVSEKDDNDPELYKWTLSLRRNYRHQVKASTSLAQNRKSSGSSPRTASSSNSPTRRPYLSDAKMKLLRAVEFPWDVQSYKWDCRYQQLKQFYDQHGHTNVPPKNSQRWPAGLGIWVRNQRREYKKLLLCSNNNNNNNSTGVGNDGDSSIVSSSTLTPERLEALQKLNFQWYRSHDEAWNMRFQQLREFVKEHGHPNVPEDYSTNPQLGQWVMNQRTAYFGSSKTVLSIDRIQKLESIGFIWKYREHKWNTMKDRLSTYYHQNGNVTTTISTQDTNNTDLRLWLNQQRFYYNQRRNNNNGGNSGNNNPTTTNNDGGGDGDDESESTWMTDTRIKAMEEAIPNFQWKLRGIQGPQKEDWEKLFSAMRAKGIQPGMRPKQHWFEGEKNRFSTSTIKHTWTEEELLELWNQEDDDDE